MPASFIRWGRSSNSSRSLLTDGPADAVHITAGNSAPTAENQSRSLQPRGHANAARKTQGNSALTAESRCLQDRGHVSAVRRTKENSAQTAANQEHKFHIKLKALCNFLAFPFRGRLFCVLFPIKLSTKMRK